MKLCDSSINGFYEAMKKTLSTELRLLSLTLLAVWMGLGVSAKPNEKEPLKPTTVLYDRVLNRDNPDPELIFEDRTEHPKHFRIPFFSDCQLVTSCIGFRAPF